MLFRSTATYNNGGNGSTDGLIDTQSAVGGWPELLATEPPVDSDNDGMSDHWEDSRGLNKYSPEDAQLTTVDGKYPNIEAYINSLVADITAKKLEDALTTGIPPLVDAVAEPEIFFQPSTGQLRIGHQIRIRIVQVYSVTGALLTTQMAEDHSAELQVREKGILVLRITDENNRSFSKKLISK